MTNQHNDDLIAKRHSLSHVVMNAIKDLWPDAIPGVGPWIEDGFYHDFDSKTQVSEKDFAKIEKQVKKIIKQNQEFEYSELPIDEGIEKIKNFGYKYTVELAEDLKAEGESKISFYKNGNFENMCKGPHVAKTMDINPESFKLTRIAGSYWKGDEKNKMLQRIYGVYFDTKEELEQYLERQEQAKLRDHRKVGKDLGLFTFSDMVGKGLPLLTEKGAAIRRELERFIVDEEIKRGYKHVKTPELANVKLFETSGHYPYYKDDMYPVMEVDDEKLILRPMTCPHHFMLYKDQPRSYRDLPYRIAEPAELFRYEQSGELSGLIRVRKFCLADSHNIVRKQQAKDEIKFVLDLIQFVSDTLGLKKGLDKDYWYRLSKGDKNNSKKYYEADSDKWPEGENILRQALQEIDAPFIEESDEAAFYGPKIDVQMRNVNGKEDTAFTVQYDFCMPERFKMSYKNEKGEDEQPVVIHRSSIGAFERIMAFLIEHYAGNFPVWLAPIQVKFLPISDDLNDYTKEIADRFATENIRIEIDDASESLGSKIRKAKLEKIPYILVIGKKEMESDSVAVNKRGSDKKAEVMKVDEFLKQVKKEIENKTIF